MNMRHKENREIVKYVITLLLVLAISIVVAISVGNDRIISLSSEFHYALLTTGATLLGFIITDISVLFACMENAIIKRLWQNHYLDNTFRVVLTEAASCLMMITASIGCLIFENLIAKYILKWVEIISLFQSLIYLAVCIFKLAIIFEDMRKDNKKHANSSKMSNDLSASDIKS